MDWENKQTVGNDGLRLINEPLAKIDWENKRIIS